VRPNWLDFYSGGRGCQPQRFWNGLVSDDCGIVVADEGDA
jgi:hypothetical protein